MVLYVILSGSNFFNSAVYLVFQITAWASLVNGRSNCFVPFLYQVVVMVVEVMVAAEAIVSISHRTVNISLTSSRGRATNKTTANSTTINNNK